MFQKLKPVDASSAAATDQGKKSNPSTAETNAMTPDNNTNNPSSSSSDVELDGLQRASQNPSTSYSPRPATAPSAGFSSFPTARPAGSPQSSEFRNSTGDNRKLVIGEGINISGEIEACNHLVVEGQVEASLKGANILDIAESGVFFGSVEINEGTVAGRFEGDLKVDGRLTIRSTGVIIGSLSYRELAVEAGATIEGKITPLNGKASVRSSGSSTTGKSSTSSQQSGKRPNNDTELPFATKAAS